MTPTRTASSTTVDAPADTVFDHIVDVAPLPHLSPTILHTEHDPVKDDEDVVQIWTVTKDEQVWSRTIRRSLDRAALRVSFVDEDADGQPTGVRGAWTLRDVSGGKTEVELAFEIDGEAPESPERLEAARLDLLTTVTDAAQRRDELADLVVDFTDPLYAAGSAEDAYQILYEADKWPERLHHVARIDMTENVPNVQFFDMDTSTPDGRAHTTRSVRLCFPHYKIIYKQIGLPALLDAHTGHWRFTEDRDGLVIESRHTAVIKPSALHILGPGTTVEDARRYLRKVLSTNSMTNLRLAKQFAEERAGA
ncbi:SRPBCC family protein [Couchioplanes caeruleus]|uniref:SRPBCC family protein n=1 Tax=Couchioplanes caeruleus TaxID=56438 RepID=UPI0020BFBE28|nr:SRPBCC family protein [Couchioplanes caeruleus]UQU67669.1 SRPBCC family protein [Couchioplanes caeruleus]